VQAVDKTTIAGFNKLNLNLLIALIDDHAVSILNTEVQPGEFRWNEATDDDKNYRSWQKNSLIA
jgi:hypothetical protein